MGLYSKIYILSKAKLRWKRKIEIYIYIIYIGYRIEHMPIQTKHG